MSFVIFVIATYVLSVMGLSCLISIPDGQQSRAISDVPCKMTLRARRNLLRPESGVLARYRVFRRSTASEEHINFTIVKEKQQGNSLGIDFMYYQQYLISSHGCHGVVCIKVRGGPIQHLNLMMDNDGLVWQKPIRCTQPGSPTLGLLSLESVECRVPLRLEEPHGTPQWTQAVLVVRKA